MVRCSCGHRLAYAVGDGYILEADGKDPRWLRRRSDRLVCPGCGQAYRLEELTQLQGATAQPRST